jgi:DNA-binding PadR family transcriptional regulator
MNRGYTILDFRFWILDFVVSLSRTTLDWENACLTMVLQNEVMQVQPKVGSSRPLYCDIFRYIVIINPVIWYVLMFKPFCSPFFAPAWASATAEAPCDRHWFQHGKRSRGKWFDEDPSAWGEGGGPRTRRGDIKFLLLELLSEQPSHGYDLIKQIETRYGGFRRLSPGSVYPTLQLLEEGGYVTSEPSEGKRVYTITDAGRQLLAERSEQSLSGNPWDAFRPTGAARTPELNQLRQAATELAGAVTQVARSGNADRISRVRELLDRTKREIYAILAEE